MLLLKRVMSHRKPNEAQYTIPPYTVWLAGWLVLANGAS